jgi:hypothetical protein
VGSAVNIRALLPAVVPQSGTQADRFRKLVEYAAHSRSVANQFAVHPRVTWHLLNRAHLPQGLRMAATVTTWKLLERHASCMGLPEREQVDDEAAQIIFFSCASLIRRHVGYRFA